MRTRISHSTPFEAAVPTSAEGKAGLSEEQAAQRLQHDGLNELPSAKPRTAFALALDVLREPMLLLLVGTVAVYVVLGDPKEALALLGAIIVIIGISFYQERRTERALHALRNLSSPRALVVRGGNRRRIPAREVVRDDLVVLSEGDRVPADGVLIEARNLSLDESLLTGESVAVHKTAQPGMELGRPGGDNSPFVFSGTLVVRGRGIAEVKAVGTMTELGKIGKSLQTLAQERTGLQNETRRLVRVLASLGFLLCILVAVAYGITRGDWLHGILAGLTLAISMVPEEFPVVLTIFLALGAWRISRQRVLTRRMPAIEALGAATVLCVDKTGTLTLNRMSVTTLFASGRIYDLEHGSQVLPDEVHELVEYSILASSRDPFEPMERAFLELGQRTLQQTEHLHSDWELVKEYPLSRELLAMSRVWQGPGSNGYAVAVKGAPEAVFRVCGMAAKDAESLATATDEMAAKGLRVLGVAKARWLDGELPPEHTCFRFEFLGLVGLTDPVRPGVPAAIKEAHEAGIRVVMITGDYPVTAQNIARQIGLTSQEVLTGRDVDQMDDAELQRRVQTVNVFARVVPEQKLRLVQALQSSGEVVGMTGDGVNDAPALKAADIGIAMGERGTDVAREAAALVLLDDQFASIIKAIRLGRRIYDNLKKATSFIFAIHIPIAGLTLVPIVLGWPLILLPLHILFLELILDPIASVAFEAEPEESEIMKRPPRSAGEHLFTFRRFGISSLQGAGALAIVLGIYSVALLRGNAESDARTLAFATLVIGNLGLVFANRSWTRSIVQTVRTPNPVLWWITGAAVLLLTVVIYVDPLRSLFKLSVLQPADIGIVLASGLVCATWFEALKAWSETRSLEA